MKFEKFTIIKKNWSEYAWWICTNIKIFSFFYSWGRVYLIITIYLFINIKLLYYIIILILFLCAHYTHDRRWRGGKKDIFQKKNQILLADYIYVWFTHVYILCICVHRCRIKRTMCRRYAPQESGRITHTCCACECVWNAIYPKWLQYYIIYSRIGTYIIWTFTYNIYLILAWACNM